MLEDLSTIAAEMDALLGAFVQGGSLTGLFLPAAEAARFKALAFEAKGILDEELRPLNDYSIQLHGYGNASRGLTGGPSHADVEEAAALIRAGVRAIERKRAAEVRTAPAGPRPYVDGSRILALQDLKGSAWDFARLAELCREINVAAANRCHMSTAMLLRSILNHVPPVLGFGTFAEVASNYGGPASQKSFKQAMQRLQGSLRSIADMHLHTTIRAQEDLPTAVQVDFSQELDLLLGEVIRVARAHQA